MPSYNEMISAYNPVTSSLLDAGADPSFFDLSTQHSLNSYVDEKASAVGSKLQSWWHDPTTFFDDVEKASDSANALLTNGDPNLVNALLGLNPFGDSNGAPAGNPAAPRGGSTRTSTLTYQNADLAAAYGMNSATAYQEALANTAHQREVADLRAAGLNPVLSATQARGAGTVSSAEPLAAPAGGSNSATSFKETLGNIKSVLSLVKAAKSIFM